MLFELNLNLLNSSKYRHRDMSLGLARRLKIARSRVRFNRMGREDYSAAGVRKIGKSPVWINFLREEELGAMAGRVLHANLNFPKVDKALKEAFAKIAISPSREPCLALRRNASFFIILLENRQAKNA